MERSVRRDTNDGRSGSNGPLAGRNGNVSVLQDSLPRIGRRRRNRSHMYACLKEHTVDLI